jgi:hypothetical protein
MSKTAENCDHNINPLGLFFKDVLIIISGDFDQFLAKIGDFFSKVMYN